MSGPLARFFETAGPFIFGELDAEGMERALGSSRSGTRRLALYPELVRAQHRQAMRTLFAALGRALERVTPGLFAELVDAYLVTARSTRWNPSYLGARFADFLAAERAHDDRIPPWAEEAADFTFLEFEVGRSASSLESSQDGVHPALAVRRYQYDVPALVHGRTSGPPRLGERTLMVFPGETGRPRALGATLAMLFDVAIARKQATREDALGAGISCAALTAARRTLIGKRAAR